jgi:hypothetical protein
VITAIASAIDYYRRFNHVLGVQQDKPHDLERVEDAVSPSSPGSRARP